LQAQASRPQFVRDQSFGAEGFRFGTPSLARRMRNDLFVTSKHRPLPIPNQAMQQIKETEM